jgi:hypothetical protein
MTAPVQRPADILTYVMAPPARRWFAKKRFILPAVAVAFFAAGFSLGASRATSVRAPAPAALVLPGPVVTVSVPGPAVTVAVPGPTITVTVPGPAPAPAPAPAPVIVASAPVECGRAIDLMSDFVTAVEAEHTAMGAAFTKVLRDGDSTAMASSVSSAFRTMTSTTDIITPKITAAAAVCRAAIK